MMKCQQAKTVSPFPKGLLVLVVRGELALVVRVVHLGPRAPALGRNRNGGVAQQPSLRGG
jgi:hypothetical protein